MNFTRPVEGSALSQLTLEEVAQLQKDVARYQEVATEHLGVNPNLPVYQQCEQLKRMARVLSEMALIENDLRENGYKSLKTAVYGLLKSKRTDLIRPEWMIAPSHHATAKVNRQKAQKRWETLLPMINQFVADLENDSDEQAWAEICALNDGINELSYDELAEAIYDYQHRFNLGEFDQEAINARIEKRLENAKARQGLLPAAPTPDLKILPGSEKIEWKSDVKAFTPETKAVVAAAEQRLAEMTDEERQLYESLFG